MRRQWIAFTSATTCLIREATFSLVLFFVLFPKTPKTLVGHPPLRGRRPFDLGDAPNPKEEGTVVGRSSRRRAKNGCRSGVTRSMPCR